VCCSVLQWVCCSVLQCAAVCCNFEDLRQDSAVCHSIYLQKRLSKTISFLILSIFARSVLWCVSVSMLQCVAVCCCVLQCVAVAPSFRPHHHSPGLCVSYEWDMSQYQRVHSHIWMSHVSHVTHITIHQVYVFHTYESVTPHVRMSHVAHTTQSRHTYKWDVSHVTETYEWVMSPTWPRHMNESCLTHDRDIWMSHVSHMTETYEWVMSHTWLTSTMSSLCVSHRWMRHAAHTNGSCHTCEWVMQDIRVSQTYK